MGIFGDFWNSRKRWGLRKWWNIGGGLLRRWGWLFVGRGWDVSGNKSIWNRLFLIQHHIQICIRLLTKFVPNITFNYSFKILLKCFYFTLAERSTCSLLYLKTVLKAWVQSCMLHELGIRWLVNIFITAFPCMPMQFCPVVYFILGVYVCVCPYNLK